MKEMFVRNRKKNKNKHNIIAGSTQSTNSYNLLHDTPNFLCRRDNPHCLHLPNQLFLHNFLLFLIFLVSEPNRDKATKSHDGEQSAKKFYEKVGLICVHTTIPTTHSLSSPLIILITTHSTLLSAETY